MLYPGKNYALFLLIITESYIILAKMSIPVIRQIIFRPYLYLLIILLGTAAKFYKIDSRLFWEDEVSTVFHTSGIDMKNNNELIPENVIRSKSLYDNIIHLNRQPYTITSQLTGLAHETNITPGHYAFLVFWQRLAGDSPHDFRLFSVFIFILTLPFLFLLAKMLFKQDLAGWIAVSLYSVSPFIQFYSQEARYYILWAFFFILMNYLFLNTIRKNSLSWLIFYSVTAVFSLYVSVLSALFISGHFLYVMFFKKDMRIKFFIALSIVFLCYIPWIYSLYLNRQEISTSLAWHKSIGKPNPFSLLILLLLGITNSFIQIHDGWIFNMSYKPFSEGKIWILLLDVFTLVLVIYALFYLIRKVGKETKWFILLIFLPNVLILFVSDMIRKSYMSSLIRYQTIGMVCGQIIVTALLFEKIKKDKLRYFTAFLALVAIGAFSVFKFSQNRCWNCRNDCNQNFEDARMISQSNKPLLISDFKLRLVNFMVILNACEKQDIDVLYATDPRKAAEKLDSTHYSDIFLIQSSDNLINHFKAKYGKRMTLVRDKVNAWSPAIWKITE